ncbi:hypothetical protein LPJ78_004944 [Coemansia sp. RSA 989]|nr:hypothetical protein LPJ68_004121 [Coemansia sp. RSA 1086]KAJ1748523.1 hypothetical protein LPJ79_004444 [Coemansia sp. RSA 1821]KAJ1862073.1 hypothetical protein LPJ78_004944 [Coemansia sp. RSA 989]KAJ1871242.1 hypothetical protein LPJ55_004027 [Coemansia sp. RSA 990]KAJ2673031.1 hypothetical protein IWW42_002583 [Coemansia sp. RSA 1085]
MSDIHSASKSNVSSSSTSSKAISLRAIESQAAEVVLSWENLVYKVPSNIKGQEQRTILHGLWGEIRAGETIALIGSSGAGKTTLLNALSGRIVGGELSGKVLFCGSKRNSKVFKRVTSFVQQDDLMHPLLTVQETLAYASNLRLPSSEYTAQDKNNRVNTVIRQLRLEAARNTRIGNEETRGVSGGERKRVSIGTELLTDPRLLFLDEPTSGLDSNSSELVVELVKGISQEQGIATLMTIHQPSAHIFNTFDKVILLSQGRVIYFGPTSTAIEYFSKIGYECPVHENPADYFVSIMTLDYRSEETLTRSKEQVQILADAFVKHANMDSKQCLEKSPHPDEAGSLNSSTREITISRNSWLHEYLTLTKRDWLNIKRNVNYCGSQIGQPVAMGLLIGFMFFQLKHDGMSIQNRLGVIYIILVQSSMAIFFPPLALFSNELRILTRERSVAAYRLTAYYAAKTTIYIPIILTCNTSFFICTYFLSHLVYEASKFFIGLGVFYIVNVVYVMLMMLVGSAIPAIEVAYVMASATLTVQFLFGGYFVNFRSVTPVLRWIRWVDPIYYAFSALGQNEMNSLKFDCAPGEQCFENGKQVLDYYSLDRFTIWQNVLLLLMLGVVFYAIGYACLRWKSKPRYILI